MGTSEYIEIGKITNTHGVRGEVKVLPLTDDPQRYDSLKWVYIDKNGILDRQNIESVKYFKNFVIIKFKEINDMSSAEKLKDLLLKVDRKNAVKLPEYSYFIYDLIDCEVFDEATGNLLGRLVNIIKTGSNDVYVVECENSREILIPALRSVVKVVSIRDKRITVSLPEGLVEDEV